MAVCYTQQLSNIKTVDHLDAEYYHTKYLYLDILFRKRKDILGNMFKVIPGYAFPSELFKEKGIFPVVKMTQIPGDGFVNISNAEFINESSFQEDFNNFFIEEDDVVVALTGATVGKSGLYIEDKKSLLNQRVLLVRDTSKENSTRFLLALFSSKIFRDYVFRNSLGGGQGNVSPESIKNFPVIGFSYEFMKKVELLVEQAKSLYKDTKKCYPEAEQELLDRIDWDKVETSHVLNYATTSKKIFEKERLDPEFYQPKFEHLFKQLRKAGAKKLSEFCPLPNRGVQPVYVDQGDIIVVNSKHLGPTDIDIENSERTSELFYEEENVTKSRLQQYDVLMYSTGAYVGRTNVYLEEMKGIASNHVTIIRPDRKICNPVYLALFLNSPAGLMQTDQRASGSAQREIYPQNITGYQIFIPQNKDGKPDLAWQKKLADKVVQANQAKKEAKQNLQEAKELVEKEIEKITKQSL